MEKCIFVLTSLMLLLTLGCSKETKSSDKYLELQKTLINKLSEENYLDEKNFKSLNIIDTLEHGYYKSDETKKNIEVHFTYECKDNKKSCIHDILTQSEDYYVLWIYADTDTIYKVSKGISIDYKDIDSGDYVRSGYHK